jgi:hypothetical protein
MAAFALGVQGIAPFGIAVRAMAILTATRHGTFLFFVMAIIARNTIPGVARVCLVIKQNLSRSGFEHEPYRFFRGFLREPRVADNAYDEQDCRKGKCKRLFSLWCHLNLTFLSLKLGCWKAGFPLLPYSPYVWKMSRNIKEHRRKLPPYMTTTDLCQEEILNTVIWFARSVVSSAKRGVKTAWQIRPEEVMT